MQDSEDARIIHLKAQLEGAPRKLAEATDPEWPTPLTNYIHRRQCLSPSLLKLLAKNLL
jgi:hypothetical protein